MSMINYFYRKRSTLFPTGEYDMNIRRVCIVGVFNKFD